MTIKRAVVVLAIAGSASVATGQFRAGHLYTTTDNGRIWEWNSLLQNTRQFSVNGPIQYASGLCFNDNNNLVMFVSKENFTKIIEVNSNGTILREFNTGVGGLNRGSYIDFDSASRRYVFADHHRVTVLSHDLTYVASSTADFSRTSGVGFAPGGMIYATDQFGATLRRFDSSTLTEMTPLVIGGGTNTGFDVSASGDVLLTKYADGAVKRLVGGQLPITTVVSGLTYGNVSDVRHLPNGHFVTTNSNAFLKEYSAAGVLLRSGTSTNGSSDAVAYFVPAPGSCVLLIGLASALARRRR